MFELDQLFQKSDLIPVIIQDADTKDVLMLGFTNREAVGLTLKTRTAWFWSRSRKQLWNKGGDLGQLPPCRQNSDGLRHRYAAVFLPAGRPCLPYRSQKLLF